MARCMGDHITGCFPLAKARSESRFDALDKPTPPCIRHPDSGFSAGWDLAQVGLGKRGKAPYHTASHTTPHTTLHLNKSRGVIRQRKLSSTAAGEEGRRAGL